MGSKQPATTTQIQKVELPAWVDAASQSNYQSAEQLAAKPFTPYTGQRVADLSDQERQASGTLTAGMGLTNAALTGAGAVAGRAAGFTPGQVQGPAGVAPVAAQGFLSRDVGQYMDPEVNNVIDANRAQMQRDNAGTLQAQSDAARGAGAWGGSRFGVQQAVTAAEGNRNIATMDANLRSQAFNNAATRIQGDNASALQAALANQGAAQTTQAQQLAAAQGNQQAGIAGAGINLQAGSLLNTIGQTSSDTAGRNALLQTQLGANERSVTQQQLDASKAAFDEQQQYPTEMLNMRLAALGMSPYGKTTTGTTTQTGGSSSNGVMTGIGAAATILPLLFSDKKVKKNIKKIGKVGDTDLNAYEFQYKPGFMGGPNKGKQIGLMAQDVEKKVPGAVKKVQVPGAGTVKAVDYGKALSEAKPRDGRDDKGKIRGTYKPRGVGIGFKMRAA